MKKLFLILKAHKHKCSEKKRLTSQSKRLFNNYYPILFNFTTNSSLHFALRLGTLAVQFGKASDLALFRTIKNRFASQKEPMTTQNLKDFSQVLTSFDFQGDQRPILQKFKKHLDQGRHLMSQQDLAHMQINFVRMRQKVFAFEDFHLNFQSSQKRRGNIIKKEINMYGKRLTLYGIQHGDQKGLRKVIQDLQKPEPKTVILEIPTLQANQVKPFKADLYNQLNPLQSPLPEIKFPLKYLKNQLVKYYVEQYIMYRKQFFQVRKNQQAIYYWDSQWLPHQFATLIYNQYIKKMGNQFVLADLTFDQEIDMIAKNLSLKEIKKQFSQIRLIYLMEQLTYLNQASKKGCQKCHGNQPPLFSPVSYADPRYLGFVGRQMSFTNVILDCLQSQSKNRIVGVFGSDHLQSIINNINRAQRFQTLKQGDQQLSEKKAILMALYNDQVVDKVLKTQVQQVKSLLKLQGNIPGNCHAWNTVTVNNNI